MTDKRRPMSLTINGEKFDISDGTAKLTGYVACEFCKEDSGFEHCANLYKIALVNSCIFIYSSRPICESCRTKLFKTVGETTND